jgi:hypothetical protein
MRVVGLFGVTALRSRDAHCLHWHSRLDNSAANVVGFFARFGDGCNAGRADWFDYRNICEHPQNWHLRLHGACDLSVVIGMGYGNAC